MSEARFWIGVAHQFAAAGNEANANLASNKRTSSSVRLRQP